MKATLYTTDEKNGFSQKRLFYNNAKMDAICTATVSDNTINESFSGFGVAITGASCYELSTMSEEARDKFLCDIYGTDGINLSVGRLSIGSSDYSADVYSYCDKKNDMKLESFSIERDMEYIVPMIKEILNHNPNIKLFASPWSPPGWMKTEGSMCGGYMKWEYIDCYADYIIKYLQAYKKEGIEISAITPQNEPETQQVGHMPACIWHPDFEVKFVEVLRKKMTALGMDTEIWLFDHNFSNWMRVLHQLRNNPNLINDCNAIAFHYYDGTVEMIDKLKSEYPNIKWNFTEGGPRLYDNYDSDWCKWSLMMSKALNMGCDSFTGWNLLLDENGGPNIGPFFCGGLATLNSQTHDLTYSGQYKALRHFSKFIKPGASIYPVKVDNYEMTMFAFPKSMIAVEGTAAKNKDGSHVLQLANANSSKVQMQYFYGGKWWYIELMPNTAATIVFE